MTAFNPPFSAKIEQAIELAAQWHDLTYRKTRWREAAFDVPPQEVLRVPVMAHVTAVAMIVQRAGWDEDVVAAAFLHDAVEDVNRYGMVMRRERLVELVGPRIAELVLEVSEEKFDIDGKLRSWRERKNDYIANIRRARTGAVVISLADKLHNLWSINESLARGIDLFSDGGGWENLNAGPEEQHWFYCEVLEASRKEEDERFEGLRRKFEVELDRFVELAGITQ